MPIAMSLQSRFVDEIDSFSNNRFRKEGKVGAGEAVGRGAEVVHAPAFGELQVAAAVFFVVISSVDEQDALGRELGWAPTRIEGGPGLIEVVSADSGALDDLAKAALVGEPAPEQLAQPIWRGDEHEAVEVVVDSGDEGGDEPAEADAGKDHRTLISLLNPAKQTSRVEHGLLNGFRRAVEIGGEHQDARGGHLGFAPSVIGVSREEDFESFLNGAPSHLLEPPRPGCFPGVEEDERAAVAALER